jgi:hypothetical protein
VKFLNKRLITIVLFVILIFVLPSVFPAAVTFNVYQSRGPTFTVSGINVDCNGTTYDRTSQTSPFTINFDSNVYSCVISNTNSNWESTTVDVNTATVHTETVYMDFENYPVVYQFLQSVDASTSANTLQTVASWTYTPSFGTDTNVQVGCSISILASAHAFTAEWAIQSSPDGSTWTTQGTVSRVLTTSMVGSVYVSTGTWSVADGTRYFRLMHRRTTTPTAAVITSKNAVCDLFTNKSDNNSTIKTSNIVVGDTTVSGATYGTLTTSTFATSAYNGFLVTLGAINYKQNNSNDSTIGFRIYYNSTTAVAEYPRFVVKNTNASGSFAEYTDVNANQNVNLVFQGKRSAATSTINIPGAFVYHLSQDPNEYAQVNLASKTVSSASYVPRRYNKRYLCKYNSTSYLFNCWLSSRYLYGSQRNNL